jgi:hypothetical protein
MKETERALFTLEYQVSLKVTEAQPTTDSRILYVAVVGTVSDRCMSGILSLQDELFLPLHSHTVATKLAGYEIFSFILKFVVSNRIKPGIF